MPSSSIKWLQWWALLRVDPVAARAMVESDARQRLAVARAEWPGFCEREGDIKRVLQSDRALSLRGAYERVCGGWTLTPEGFTRQ